MSLQQVTPSPDMTMESILEVFPSAQRALFQRYHVGGCSSCGFQPSDTLAQVCSDHNILDVNEVVEHILLSHEVDQKMQVEPTRVKAWLDAQEDLRFIDVRMPQELEQVRLQEAEALDFGNQSQYMELSKDTRMVFFCKSGQRSLDVAAYFAGHGFTQVYSMRAGLDGWRAEIDPSLPDYDG